MAARSIASSAMSDSSSHSSAGGDDVAEIEEIVVVVVVTVVITVPTGGCECVLDLTDSGTSVPPTLFGSAFSSTCPAEPASSSASGSSVTASHEVIE